MKKLLFLILISSIAEAKDVIVAVPDGSQAFVVIASTTEVKVIENDVLDSNQWLQDAWKGKLNSCKKRLIRQELDKSIQEAAQGTIGPMVPLTETAIIDKAFSRPDYLSRKDRELIVSPKP